MFNVRWWWYFVTWMVSQKKNMKWSSYINDWQLVWESNLHMWPASCWDIFGVMDLLHVQGKINLVSCQLNCYCNLIFDQNMQLNFNTVRKIWPDRSVCIMSIKHMNETSVTSMAAPKEAVCLLWSTRLRLIHKLRPILKASN